MLYGNDRHGHGGECVADTYGDADANSYANAYAITYAYAHPINITYAHTYAVAYAYAHPISITYAHTYAIAYAYCFWQCHFNANRKNIADAETASDSAAASHTRRSDGCHVHFHAKRHWRGYGCSS